MENEEKDKKESKFTEQCCGTSFWDGKGMFETMAGCCGADAMI